MAQSGYTDCACRDCFEIAVSDDMEHPDLCSECEEAGCDATGQCECDAPGAYGGEECEKCGDGPQDCECHDGDIVGGREEVIDGD